MKTENLITIIYILMMGHVAIGSTIHINSELYDSIWYSSVWATIITGGIHFSMTAKSKFISLVSMGFVSWFFSMFTFEVIGIFNQEILSTVDKPSATYVWYLMAFMAFIILIAFRYGRKTH